MRKAIGIVFVSLYMAIIVDFALAQAFYQAGRAEQSIDELQKAVALNPWSSDYRYAIFEQSGRKDLESIKETIRLEPLKGFYHMVYGLALLQNERTEASDQKAFYEIKRAYELKPYSDLYRRIYQTYAKPYETPDH